jgi:GNAT superfamily N-acetyltransferase
VATGSTAGSEARLDRLIVSEADRQQGIGGHILSAVERLAIERGCSRLVLVAQADGVAETFYRGRGWVAERALPDWRNGRDFVRMVRELR